MPDSSLRRKEIDVEKSSIFILPLSVLDMILAISSSGEAHKLALLALVCKTFSVPGRAVSGLSIDNSVETKAEGALNLYKVQCRLSRLVHLVPNVTKIRSSVEVSPLTLSYWSKTVGKTLTSLQIPELELGFGEVLHTFPVLEELKVSVMPRVLEKGQWKGFQNFFKILKLEVEIVGESPNKYNRVENDDLVFFLKLFPNLVSLAVKSDQFSFEYTVGHSNVSLLILEISAFDGLDINCPNLRHLKLLPRGYGNRLYLGARKFATEVEIMEDLDDGKVKIKCEVDKEFYVLSRNECTDSRCLTFDIMMHCKSVRSLSIEASELLYLFKFGEKFWFPDVYWREEGEEMENFNLGLHVAFELEENLLSPSLEELRFTSKNRLGKVETKVFKNRYKMLKRLYPNITFSCSDA